MAKKGATVKVKMVSTAGTGYYYVTKVNKKTKTEKLVKKKFDPRAKHAVTVSRVRTWTSKKIK